jgi:hypothetical protein
MRKVTSNGIRVAARNAIQVLVNKVRRVLSEGIDRTTTSITSSGNAIRRIEKRNQRMDKNNPTTTAIIFRAMRTREVCISSDGRTMVSIPGLDRVIGSRPGAANQSNSAAFGSDSI